MKFNEKIIHDENARDEVFFRAKAKLEILQEEMEEAKKDKCITKHELIKKQIEIDTLKDLFKEKCIKYIQNTNRKEV